MSDRIVEKTSPFLRLFKKVWDLAPYGENAVFRRILNVIVEEANGAAHREELMCMPDRNCGPDRTCRPDRCLSGQPLDVMEAIEEFRQDDRRRSVFLDPSEAVLAHLLDLYTGRLNVVEFRDGNTKGDSISFHDLVAERIRNALPLVIVNQVAAETTSQIITALRLLADSLENGDLNREIELKSAVATLSAEQCRTIRTEQRGQQWINAGRTLQYQFVEVVECCRRDGCCGNATCYTRDGASQWTTAWDNAGNSSQPPPTPPPDFGGEPWNDRLPVLADEVPAQLSSRYGWRRIDGQSDFHGGIDIAASIGTRIRSTNSGTVVHINSSGYNGGVVVQWGNTTFSYWHVQPDPQLAIGQAIQIGELIGTIAGGGDPHCHYAIHNPPNGDWQQRSDANSQNPLP